MGDIFTAIYILLLACRNTYHSIFVILSRTKHYSIFIYTDQTVTHLLKTETSTNSNTIVVCGSQKKFSSTKVVVILRQKHLCLYQ